LQKKSSICILNTGEFFYHSLLQNPRVNPISSELVVGPFS